MQNMPINLKWFWSTFYPTMPMHRKPNVCSLALLPIMDEKINHSKKQSLSITTLIWRNIMRIMQNEVFCCNKLWKNMRFMEKIEVKNKKEQILIHITCQLYHCVNYFTIFSHCYITSWYIWYFIGLKLYK